MSEVKLGELGAWFSRREKGLLPTYRLVSRAHQRWLHNYAMVRHGGWAHVWQGLFILGLICYIECWPKYSKSSFSAFSLIHGVLDLNYIGNCVVFEREECLFIGSGCVSKKKKYVWCYRVFSVKDQALSARFFPLL